MNDAEIKKLPLFRRLLVDMPHLERERAEFNAEFRTLSSRDDSFVGRFLTCHLLVEHFLTDYLEAAFPGMPELRKTRLTFDTKVSLAKHPQIGFFLFWRGVKCLNVVRNKLAHRIGYKPTDSDLEPIRFIMDNWNAAGGKPLTRQLEMIEDMTLLVCGILSGVTKGIRRRNPSDGLTGYLESYRNDASNETDA